MKHIVVDIGCLECEVPANIVGVFDDKKMANTIATKFNKTFGRFGEGHHKFEVFEMPKLNFINTKYLEIVANIK